MQVGRQLDKLPADTRRNILSLSRVKTGSPLSPEPPFLSLSSLLPKSCIKKDQRSIPGCQAAQAKQASVLQTNEDRGRGTSPTHTENHLTHLCSGAPSQLNPPPNTKTDPPLLRRPSPPPPTKDSEHFKTTLKLSDQRGSSRTTSMPSASQTDSVQLNLPSDGASQSVKYSRSPEEGLGSDQPAHRTEEGVEQFQNTAL